MSYPTLVYRDAALGGWVREMEARFRAFAAGQITWWQFLDVPREPGAPGVEPNFRDDGTFVGLTGVSRRGIPWCIALLPDGTIVRMIDGADDPEDSVHSPSEEMLEGVVPIHLDELEPQ